MCMSYPFLSSDDNDHYNLNRILKHHSGSRMNYIQKPNLYKIFQHQLEYKAVLNTSELLPEFNYSFCQYNNWNNPVYSIVTNTAKLLQDQWYLCDGELDLVLHVGLCGAVKHLAEVEEHARVPLRTLDEPVTLLHTHNGALQRQQ